MSTFKMESCFGADIDVAAAASDLAMAESALTASQKLFARVSNLSLFNQI
ncbi:hypothetical protein [Marinomonas epiphytica]